MHQRGGLPRRSCNGQARAGVEAGARDVTQSAFFRAKCGARRGEWLGATCDRPGSARARGGEVAKKAAAHDRGRKGSENATQSVATHASIHRARRSLQVGRVGGLPEPRSSRKAHPSSFRLQATTNGPPRLSGGRLGHARQRGSGRPVRKNRALFAEHCEGIGPGHPARRKAGLATALNRRGWPGARRCP